MNIYEVHLAPRQDLMTPNQKPDKPYLSACRNPHSYAKKMGYTIELSCYGTPYDGMATGDRILCCTSRYGIPRISNILLIPVIKMA